MKLAGKSWLIIAKSFKRTPTAVESQYHILQRNGKAPYYESRWHGQIADVIKCYKIHGHRATLKKYGSYAIHFLKKNGKWKRTLPVVAVYNDRFLSSKDKYYWAGFFAADGCIRGPSWIDIGLAIKDKKHLEKIHKLAGGSMYIYKKRATATWSMHKCLPIISFFNSLNITSRKSLTLKPPKGLTAVQIRDFIRGYFDGDGCVTHSIHKSGRMVQLISFLGTFEMLKWIRKNINKQIQCKTFPAIRSDKNVFVVSYGSEADFTNIGNWFYENNKVCLKRKHDRYCKILNLRHKTSIKQLKRREKKKAKKLMLLQNSRYNIQ